MSGFWASGRRGGRSSSADSNGRVSQLVTSLWEDGPEDVFLHNTCKMCFILGIGGGAAVPEVDTGANEAIRCKPLGM